MTPRSRIQCLPRPAPLAGARRRAGLTLIELVMVAAIIAILSAAIFSIIGVIRRSAAKRGTQTLVGLVAMAISADQRRQWLVGAATYRLWDVNQDLVIDGDPDRDPAFVGAAAMRATLATGQSPYHGLAASGLDDLPRSYLERATGRILDAWRQPLHIRWTSIPGQPVQVWSAGPDQATAVDVAAYAYLPAATAAADDVRSWR